MVCSVVTPGTKEHGDGCLGMSSTVQRKKEPLIIRSFIGTLQRQLCPSYVRSLQMFV